MLSLLQARPLLKERNYPDLIDPRIVDSYDIHQLFCMVRLAEKCLSKDPQKRLTMDKVSLLLPHLFSHFSYSRRCPIFALVLDGEMIFSPQITPI